MNEKVLAVIRIMTLAAKGAGPGELAQLEQSFRVSLPVDYVEFLRISDGADGFIGNDQYLRLYSIEELGLRNKGMADFNPDLFVFGTDGGGESYSFIKSEGMKVAMVPFIGPDPETYIAKSQTFSDFLLSLESTDSC